MLPFMPFILIIYADTIYADIKFFHQSLYFFNIIVGDAFIAKPGCTLIVADYGQLELRYDPIYFLLFFQFIFSIYFFNLFFQFIFSIFFFNLFFQFFFSIFFFIIFFTPEILFIE